MTNTAFNGKNSMIRMKDLVDNPIPRVPVCLCLDISGSMGRAKGGNPTGRTVFKDGQEWRVVTGGTCCIDEMQKGIKQFYNDIREDEIARYSAEISIVTFNDKAECVMDYASIDSQGPLPQLKAEGNTDIGEGVNLALDMLEKRKNDYKQAGVDYYQPWLVLMTDGTPNGDAAALNTAIDRTREAVSAGKLTVFPIGIGSAADMESLNRFSPKRKALRMGELKFRELFAWLSRSVAAVSQSCMGDIVDLDIDALRTFADEMPVESGWNNL